MTEANTPEEKPKPKWTMWKVFILLIRASALIAIVGLIVAIGMPQCCGGGHRRAHDSDSKSNLHNLYLGCKAYWAEQGSENECRVDIVTAAEYGYVQSTRVAITGSGNESNFLAKAQHMDSTRGFMLDANGNINATDSEVAAKLKELREEIERIKEQAKRGDMEAQYQLGEMYHTGDKVSQNVIEAGEWYLKASKKGHAQAQIGFKEIEQEYLEALYQRGEMYRKGYAVKRDYKKAAKWFHKAGDLGHVKAQYDLGRYYVDGTVVRQDYAQAVKWWSKAGNQGDEKSLFRLGNMYRIGWGVKQDLTEAIKWYGKMGGQHSRGKPYIQEIQTITSYLKANERGDPNALFELAEDYLNSKISRRDYIEAAKWYHKAAKNGHVKAKNNLKEIEQDYREALFQRGLQFISFESYWWTRDYKEATKWLGKASELGLLKAQYKLAGIYRTIDRVRNYKESAKWYLMAGEQGYAPAQSGIGSMYRNGWGVSRDYIQAYKWFNLATTVAKQESVRESAFKRMGEVEKDMNSFQTAKALKLAKEWKPKTWEELSQLN